MFYVFFFKYCGNNALILQNCSVWWIEAVRYFSKIFIWQLLSVDISTSIRPMTTKVVGNGVKSSVKFKKKKIESKNL